MERKYFLYTLLLMVIGTSCSTLFDEKREVLYQRGETAEVVPLNQIVPTKKPLAATDLNTLAPELSNEVRAAALRFLRQTDQDLSKNDAINKIMYQYRGELKDVPESFWQNFFETADRRSLQQEDIRNVAVQFTLDELHKISDFFDSESGLKYLSTLPEMNKTQSINVFNWGRKVSDDLTNRLRAAGHMY